MAVPPPHGDDSGIGADGTPQRAFPTQPHGRSLGSDTTSVPHLVIRTNALVGHGRCPVPPLPDANPLPEGGAPLESPVVQRGADDEATLSLCQTPLPPDLADQQSAESRPVPLHYEAGLP
jgi:hypothetical protein